MERNRIRPTATRSSYVLAAAALAAATFTVNDASAGHRHRADTHARGVHAGVVVSHHGPRVRVYTAPAPRYRHPHRVRIAPYASPSPRYRIAFDVPVRIPRRHLDRYDTYRAAPVFHRGHDHWHSVYRFPVRSGRHVVTTRHAYCGTRLHAVRRGSRGGSWALVAGRR